MKNCISQALLSIEILLIWKTSQQLISLDLNQPLTL